MNYKTMAVVLVLAVSISMALCDDVGTSITLMGADPTVGTVATSDSIALSSSGTVTVWCNATISDNNGYADIASASAVLWAQTGSEGGSDDFNNHYTNSTCDLSTGSGTDKEATCSFQMKYSAEAGEWTCKITATDAEAHSGSGSATDVTVNPLMALSVPSSLDFGSVVLGETSNDKNLTVTNKGNSVLDLTLYTYGSEDDDGYAAVCTQGDQEIAYTALKHSLTYDQVFGSMTAIARNSTSQTAVSAFDLAKDTDSTASTKDVYFKVQIPSSNIGGTCSGHIVVTATSNS